MLSIKNKKLYILITLALLIVTGAAGTYYYLKNTASQQSSGAKSSDYNKVDYSPATSEDKSYNDQLKENTPAATDQPQNEQASQADVGIVIVDASQYDQNIEVRAYASNTLNTDGKCTITFTKTGNKSVEKTVSASPNVSNMSCATVSIPVSNFESKGDWRMVVSYAASNAKGSSSPKTVTVR